MPLLFAQQTGESARLTPGDKMRAMIYGGDPECMAFLKATETVGLKLDYGQRRGKYRLGCIGTAFEEFKRVGADLYKEALSMIVAAWRGDPESLRAETVQSVIRFIELYHDEYDSRRLIHLPGRAGHGRQHGRVQEVPLPSLLHLQREQQKEGAAHEVLNSCFHPLDRCRSQAAGGVLHKNIQRGYIA